MEAGEHPEVGGVCSAACLRMIEASACSAVWTPGPSTPRAADARMKGGCGARCHLEPSRAALAQVIARCETEAAEDTIEVDVRRRGNRGYG